MEDGLSSTPGSNTLVAEDSPAERRVRSWEWLDRACYESNRRRRDAPVQQRMRELSAQYPGYGYRRMMNSWNRSLW